MLRIEGEDNLELANASLREHSLTVVVNHPNSMGTVYAIETVRRHLSNQQRIGIVMSHRFGDGGMGKYGEMVLPTMKHWGVEYLPVYQAFENDVDQAERLELAIRTLKHARQILAEPGGIVVIFPEGTRTEEVGGGISRRDGYLKVIAKILAGDEGNNRSRTGMVPAQPGASFLADEAGVVLPLITEYKPWSMRPEVKVLTPLRIDEVYKDLRQCLTRKQAKQLLVDGLMALLAQNIPEEFRGHYAQPPTEIKLVAEIMKRYQLGK
jgi:hypothetical protein